MTSDLAPASGLQARPQRLAVLGAPGSGKTRLCADLQTALAAAPADTSAWSICDNPPLAQLCPGIDRVLLMGLDLPPGHSNLDKQRAADGQLRRMLDQAGLAYTVIYGAGAARLQNALSALPGMWPCGASLLQTVPSSPPGDKRPWVWVCDSCSDPDCERRLLSDLLTGRRG